MAKYQYKQYVTRAFWNSLFAVLSALILVLIIFYGWAGLQAVLNQIGVSTGSDNSSDEVAEDRLEMLNNLRGDDEVSMEEKYRVLEALRPPEDATISEEERLSILNSLRP